MPPSTDPFSGSALGGDAPGDAFDLIAFGGTFDPPHCGHVAMLAAARARFPSARVLALPAAAPAVAPGDDKVGPAAPFAARLAMCRVAFGPAAVSDLEASLTRPNYTINTLRRLSELHPGRRLGLLIGWDQLVQFHRWRDPEAILALATILVALRAGADPHLKPSASVLGGHRFFILSVDPGPAASRQIRAALAAGAEPPAGWLAPEVRNYIRDHHLYAAS